MSKWFGVAMGVIFILLFGLVAVGPAMADGISISQAQTPLEQQINSELTWVSWARLSNIGISRADSEGYTQPTTLSAIVDLQLALAQALQSSDWTLANTLLSDIQAIESENANNSSTTTTPPTYQDNGSAYQDNGSTYQDNSSTYQDNDSTYQHVYRHQDDSSTNGSTYQWWASKGTQQDNPTYQGRVSNRVHEFMMQPWVQRPMVQDGSNPNWWLWMLIHGGDHR